MALKYIELDVNELTRRLHLDFTSVRHPDAQDLIQQAISAALAKGREEAAQEIRRLREALAHAEHFIRSFHHELGDGAQSEQAEDDCAFIRRALSPSSPGEPAESGWQPIGTYPKEDVVGDAWGPEALVLIPTVKTHIIIDGVAQPEFAVPPRRYVAHLEADMWLTRAGDDPIAWAELDAAPTHWQPIDPLLPAPPHEPTGETE